MKYSKEERLDIGRKIYVGELTLAGAAMEYEINYYTAREYLRLYKASIGLSIPSEHRIKGNQDDILKPTAERIRYEGMSRGELIDEIIKAKVNEARAKKGYEVKGDGRFKEFRPIGNKNTK